MNPGLKITSPGGLCSIQDLGRTGYAADGVPTGGAVDRLSLRLGNALVGNDEGAAGIEFQLLGPTLTAVDGPVRIGVATEASAQKIDAEGTEQPLTTWQSTLLLPGETLQIGPGRGYLTIESGLDLPEALGSRSAYARAHLGGLGDGAALATGDTLPVVKAADPTDYDKILRAPLLAESGPIRLLAGPQDDHFDASALEELTAAPFKIGHDSDRMGLRLQGTSIQAIADKAATMVSDGLVPGAIQVPGSGQPIILGADCQTIGGYPKIATVISADLHRLGQLAGGDEVGFTFVTLAEARAALLRREEDFAAARNSIQVYLGPGAVDLNALYSANLVGGVVNALSPGHFPGHLETSS